MTTQPPFPGEHHHGQHPECCPSDPELPAVAALQGEAGQPHHKAAHTGVAALKRWLLWFLAFFGIYASSSACPFCGTPGCPVGAGSAAMVGGFFAALWQYGRQCWQWLTRCCRRFIQPRL